MAYLTLPPYQGTETFASLQIRGRCGKIVKEKDFRAETESRLFKLRSGPCSLPVTRNRVCRVWLCLCARARPLPSLGSARGPRSHGQSPSDASRCATYSTSSSTTLIMSSYILKGLHSARQMQNIRSIATTSIPLIAKSFIVHFIHRSIRTSNRNITIDNHHYRTFL